MASVAYPAVIERTATGFSAFFPDLPGCVTAGASQAELFANAEDALGHHLLISASHGFAVAEPSLIDAIERDPDVEEVGRMLVRAEKPGRAIRLNITLDEGLVSSIDRVAKNRSGFLADAARAALAAKREGVDA